MAGLNLIWHTRYDNAGTRFLVRECRICANKRYQIKRSAERRNRALEEEVLASIRESQYMEIPSPMPV